jgi:hypothetical protein
MQIGQFENLLEKALPKRRRIVAVGKVGVGKTQTFRTVCDRLGWDSILLCSPLLSPVRVGGYPVAPKDGDGDASHALFDGIARAFRATKDTLLLFDDLGMANGETLKAIVQLVQFGQIDNRTLPECVTICAATNDVGHGADVQGLIEPLKTRWHTIINVENSIDDLVVYGLANDWPADLLAYLRNCPQAMHDWKPSKSMSVDGACPRGWEYVSEWIRDGIDDPEVIGGCVGKGRATEYLAFRRLINELPDINEVLLNPAGASVPVNPGAKFLISMALASKLTSDNFGRVIEYLNRLPQMFRAFSVRDAFFAEASRRKNGTLPKGWRALSSSRDFTAWAVSQDGKDIASATA